MANYGPPGANQDPWAGQRPDGTYGRPDGPPDRGGRGGPPGHGDRHQPPVGWDEPTGSYPPQSHHGWDEPTGGWPPQAGRPGHGVPPAGAAPGDPYRSGGPTGGMGGPEPWPQPHPAYRRDEPHRQDGAYRHDEPYRQDRAYPPDDPYQYPDRPVWTGGHGQPQTDGYGRAAGYGQPPTAGYQHGEVPSAGAYPPDAGQPHDGYPGPGGYPTGEPAYLGNGRDALPSSAVPPVERRGGRGRGRMIVVLAVLAVLVLGGGATLFYLAGSDGADPDPVAAPPSATATPGDTDPLASDEPAEPSPSALAPESSADPRFAKAGQCVRNDAPAGARPKLLITECAPKTYQVLRRFDGATSGEKDAEAKCSRVEGYTDWYFYNSELDTLDFVLCLKLR